MALAVHKHAQDPVDGRDITSRALFSIQDDQIEKY